MIFLLDVIPMNVEVALVLVAFAYIIFTTTVQRRLTNAKKMRASQGKIKEIYKQLDAMIKSNAPREELVAKQREHMHLVKEMMGSQMKAMFVLIPSFLVVYYILLPALPVGISVGSEQGFFILVVFVFGILSAIAISIYDRRKLKQEQTAENKVPDQMSGV